MKTMTTDEELVEEWMRDNSYPFANCPTIEHEIRQAVLGGIKIGRSTKWHNLYKDGFKDAVSILFDKLKEAHLKEVESQFLSVLDGLSSWKPESDKEVK